MTLSRLNIFPWHSTHAKVADHKNWTWFFLNEDTKLSMKWGVGSGRYWGRGQTWLKCIANSLKEIINILFRRYVFCIPTLSVILTWRDVRFCQRSFLHLIRWACDLHFSVYSWDEQHLLICMYWTIFTFLE